MGLSNPISAIIILGVFISVLFTMPGILENIISIQETSSEVNVLENSIRNTNVNISDLEAEANSIKINFTLANNGIEKIWDYENFDVLVSYDADVAGINTKITESMTFDSQPIGGVGSPITFDDVSSFNGVCGDPIPPDLCSFPHTVTSNGNDRILVVGVTARTGESVVYVEYGGESLTQIRSDDDGVVAHTSLWFMVDPPTGPNSVDVALSSSNDVVIGAMSFLGVDQTNPIDVDNGNTGNSINPTVDLTTNIENDLIVDVVGTLTGPLFPIVLQTGMWDQSEGTLRGAGSTQVTTLPGLYTNLWTNIAGANDWAISSAALKPAPCNSLETNEWTISKITNNFLESSILNEDEIAEMCLVLTYPIFTGGNVIVVVSTDLGETVVGAITVP